MMNVKNFVLSYYKNSAENFHIQKLDKVSEAQKPHTHEYFQIYFISKGREIAAFTTQQAMPIAKEGIDEMAPTIGNAAKEIAKGIKKGLKDEEK